MYNKIIEKEKIQMKTNKKGITLIALVITIIILFCKCFAILGIYSFKKSYI